MPNGARKESKGGESRTRSCGKVDGSSVGPLYVGYLYVKKIWEGT